MKPMLALKLGQQLKMTPQLQQAIKLLQLSTLDLQQEIQSALDSNPMLEEIGDEGDESTHDSTALDTPEKNIEGQIQNDQETELSDHSALDTQPNPEIDEEVIMDASEQIASENLPENLPIDSVWEDVWDAASLAVNLTMTNRENDNLLETQNSPSISLQSHLTEQLNLLNLSETDQLIALAIIDGVDDDGVFTIDTEDVLQSIANEDIELDEVEAVLHLIQHLDPVGVAARDLSECLTIQLNQLPKTTPWRQQALFIVKDYLHPLANRDYAYLLRKTHLKEPELKAVIELIQTLKPRPAADIAHTITEYIEPDVVVSKRKDRWLVELNLKSAPQIRVNANYAALVKRSDSSSDNIYLKNHLQEARWFIKSLQQRNKTLLKVAEKIVEFQRGFFEYGEQAMRPLILQDIAEAVDLHESTVSRVTTQKYMHTPMGVFEFKHFFSSRISTHDGHEVSSTAIRALIKKLIAVEDPHKPLSDNKITNLLGEQGVKVARRTIAKYREYLLIPPSYERKQLI